MDHLDELCNVSCNSAIIKYVWVMFLIFFKTSTIFMFGMFYYGRVTSKQFLAESST
jgi:hypothetical protein